jgi:hypothetical protein
MIDVAHISEKLHTVNRKNWIIDQIVEITAPNQPDRDC